MRLALGLLAATALWAGTAHAAPTPPLRLYTLDCGSLQLQDMGLFSDTGEHAGEAGVMAVPCYLIRHGDDWLLWDTGLGDDLAALPDGKDQLGGHWTVHRTLASQLADLGLAPRDIDYVALSHLHADHSGNSGLFPGSTWLLPAEELRWGAASPAPLGVDAALVARLPHDRLRPIDGDHDVFGDGSVMILRAPGHTPGHRILLVRLVGAGPVLLSGDLFHTRELRAVAGADGQRRPRRYLGLHRSLCRSRRLRKRAGRDPARPGRLRRHASLPGLSGLRLDHPSGTADRSWAVGGRPDFRRRANDGSRPLADERRVR